MKKYLFLITSFLTALVASGATYYVVPGGAGSKNGTSWENAYADVQTAIDKASSAGGGEVWIAKGTYKHGSAMTMKNNVAIYGGFAGTETSKEQRVSGNATILDGEGKYRVFCNNYISSNPLTNSAKLDNVTIQNGYVDSNYGAGMYNYKASPEITNCTFTNNSTSSGGGMYNSNFSNPTLTNCTFTNNSASYRYGGGMYNNDSSPTLTNCTFTNNSAFSGGGMYNYSSSPMLTNCTFSGNSGCGMYNEYSSPKLTNCILWGNASSSGNEIYNYGSNYKATIDTCIIQNGKSGIYNSSYCTYKGSLITADPKLMPLGNYGGTVLTCPVGDGSSAIGVGKVAQGVSTDARGFARSITPTIGACEYQNKLIVTSITTAEGYNKYSSSYEFTLNIYVPDASNLTFQWYKDSVAIAGATLSSYKTSQNAGTSVYTVQVSDGTTTIISEMTIETLDTTRYYVSTTGSSSNDGLSWATAKSDVQDAIDLASQVYGGAEVWIAKGTYKHGFAMKMKNNVAIYGGFEGTETSKEERVANNATIFDGEGKYSVFYNDYTSSNSLTNSAKLDNVTIQNGYTTSLGAGMYNYFASPTLTNCTFSNNSSTSDGGGIYNGYSSPTLTNCTFTNNSTSASYRYGGGMYNQYYSSPVLTNCTFSGNSGGGMDNRDSSSPTLTNCILWGNTASSSGNEIYNSSSDCKITIDTCIIKGGYSGWGTYTNIITSDPKLMPLGNYGGNVPTCPVGADSSAIGSGKVVEGITIDARGFARSSTPTIGACEYQNKLTVASITTSEGYNKYSSSYEFTLNVYVSDTGGTFAYQWYKDGVAIAGATSSSYKTSQSVGTSLYTVQVSDGTTTITSEMIIETVDTTRYYVSTTGSSSNDGLSWATAKSDVQDAIDLASQVYGGAEVWIAKGTYKHGSAMTMKNNVAIYGGFAGTETSKEERIAGNNTILDGNGKYRVFVNSYSSSNQLTNTAKLDNVTIQNGYASYAAGMYNNYASPEITNCTFANNSAEYGGGMYNDDYYSSPTLTNCTFANNSASHGGGMYNYISSSPTLTNCTFANNRAEYGGGMYNYSSSLVLTNCILWGNTASSSGNEIYNYNYDSNCKATIDTCIIQNGKSGIYNSSYCTYKGSLITADPKLMPLGNYGGCVSTCPIGAGSSAIGTGKVIEGLTTDVRGFVRSATPAIGACEYVKFDITTSEENLENNILFPEESVSFKVVANETGVSYQWQYSADNSEWVDIDGAISSEFAIDSIKSENFGYYRCVMSGGIYNTKYSSVTNVVSKPAPSITTQPEALDIFANKDGSLSVSATGEELSYQWYFNGEAIEGATNATLSFENIQADKSGEYYCVITNPAGSVKSEVVSVVVKPAPSITTQPQELGVFINTDGSLSVSATGEELTYQWYFNGEAIDGATESTLSFDNIQFDKTGSYYCVITNPAGSVTSLAATVAVHQSATADSITKGLEKVTTVSGTGYARFVVETTAYNPTYKWYYGSDSAGWTEFENETSNVLFIPAESKYNRKNIKCEISNGGGTVSTQAILVYSSSAIQITSQPQDVSFKLNENASFNVTVSTSTGNAYYQWQYSTDGNEWQDIENATEATYSFKMMDSKNRGYYRCEIDNGGGVLYSENAKIIFPEDVAITTQPTTITSAIIGAKATFTVVVSGDDPKYQWQVSYDYGNTWKNIAGATNGTLGVDVVENIVDNSYRCLVWNDNNVDAPLESEMVWIENAQQPTAFQEWSIENGLGVDALPSATPHNDGITNLEKFTFGLDASKATSYSANADFKYSTDANGNATLQYPVRIDAGVDVKVLKSTDLVDWKDVPEGEIVEIRTDRDFKIYKATVPVGEEGKVFLKLKVEEK